MENLNFGLSKDQKYSLSSLLEKLMDKYSKQADSSYECSEPYFLGVVDGLNQCHKIVNESVDDYVVEIKEHKSKKEKTQDPESLVERLQKFIDSPDGNKSADEFMKNLLGREEIEKTQIERFHKKHGSNPNNFIEKVIKKYSSDSYIDKEFSFGREPRTNLYFFLFDYAHKYGKYSKAKKYQTPFSDGAYIIGDYAFALLHGQGSAINVYNIKNGEQY